MTDVPVEGLLEHGYLELSFGDGNQLRVEVDNGASLVSFMSYDLGEAGLDLDFARD